MDKIKPFDMLRVKEVKMYAHIFKQGGGTYYVFHRSQSPEAAKKILKKKGALQQNMNLRHGEDDTYYPLIPGGILTVKQGLVIGAEFNDVAF